MRTSGQPYWALRYRGPRYETKVSSIGNSHAALADVCATLVSSYAALCKAVRRGVHVTIAVLVV